MNFTPKKVILVSGANGQLGMEFRNIAKSQDTFEFLFASKENLDITDEESVLNVTKKFSPDYFINCAAYTAVDKAEKEVEKAHLINETGVENLIKACGLYNVVLIHFSTDYVYHSITGTPIKEDDPATPKGTYAKSKRAGEVALEKSNINWICFRVSWLYSSYQHNFVKSMIRLGSSRKELNIVSDQIGAPTYARDLANDIFSLISQEEYEIPYQEFYNYCNNGTTNWADFARSIFEKMNITCAVNEITTEAYGATAPRPLWSVLSLDKIENNLSLRPRKWQDALMDCLGLLKEKNHEI